MSPENKEQVATFINSIWETISSEIAESRKISREALEQNFRQSVCRNAKDALSFKIS